MLPVLNLQPTEFFSSDAAAGAASLLSADAIEPAGSFADLLQIPAIAEGDGAELPVGGKDLPLLPIGVEATDIAVPEFAGEGLPVNADPTGIEGVTLAAAEGGRRAESAPLTAPLSEAELPSLDELLAQTPVVKPPAEHTPPEPVAAGAAISAIIAEQRSAEFRDTRHSRLGYGVSGLSAQAQVTPSVIPTMPAGPVASDVIAAKEAPALHTPATPAAAEPLTAVRAETSDIPKPAPLTPPGAEILRAGAEMPAPSAQTGVEAAGRALAAEVVAAARPMADAAAVRTPAILTQAIELPVQQPGWGEAVSERVVMMAGNKIQNAEIRLSPADLGPLRVQVAIEDGTTTVNFQAQHALTRDALEQALPRLRELFAESGLSLGQTSVSDEGLQSERERQGASDGQGAVAEADAVDGDDTPESAPAQPARVANGLVDTFV